ncbi:MAG TPA: ATP synthase F1 subunit delta [Terriglobales bacterium]|nr:ATP synthase F1 subunit delta [Terriglobales bacterium]
MSAITGRYARAFADVVFDKNLDVERVLRELHSMIGVVNSSVELQRIWENPAIPSDQKQKLLGALTARLEVSRPVRNFLAVLIDHHRIAQLPEITAQFEHEVNERLGFTEAEIVSARELSEREKSELEAQIERLTGKKVRAQYATDPNVLGGAIVKVGSTIYDGSVRGQLQKIKEQLASA